MPTHAVAPPPATLVARPLAQPSLFDLFTPVCVGYTDRMAHIAVDGVPVSTLRRTRSPQTSIDRHLLVKTSSAFPFQGDAQPWTTSYRQAVAP
ncbi:hypothetical protein [Gemmatimonas sp.]|uniref:hypothetical protein n=1 Tax=Gemmatimonas sp. TaxID=1962908 RepID=UPI003982F3CF